LKVLRESRRVMLKTLAIVLGVGSTYLSALNKGRKSPPQNNSVFEKLQNHLDLSEEETEEFKRLAIATETLVPLAISASLLQLEVAVNFAECLVLLQPKQIRAIQAILDATEQQHEWLSLS
jgi:transcriptional regulator with XRE-family HTH domain